MNVHLAFFLALALCLGFPILALRAVGLRVPRMPRNFLVLAAAAAAVSIYGGEKPPDVPTRFNPTFRLIAARAPGPVRHYLLDAKVKEALPYDAEIEYLESDGYETNVVPSGVAARSGYFEGDSSGFPETAPIPGLLRSESPNRPCLRSIHIAR